jgi:hexulose-6-phosphate isomerase
VNEYSIGIMQGRLLPPVNGQIQSFPAERWPEEFELAAAAGLRSIEWIFDGPANPIMDNGAADRELAKAEIFGVRVFSVCADHFMDEQLLRATQSERAERLAVLRALVGQCSMLGVEHIVLPFVDQSAIKTANERAELADVLASVADDARAAAVELHLETSLGPQEFAAVMELLPSNVFRANYDSGNSAALGYDVREEFDAYGAWVGSVHIKDRTRGGGSVPLGTGAVDFPSLFDCLSLIQYDRRFVLQVARGIEGDEVSWASRNREFVVGHLTERHRKPR